MNTLTIFVAFIAVKDAQSDSSTLKSLHILFRHGERSPSQSYPKDPYKDHVWPGGWNQLNNRGKLEMYDLGKRLKDDYKSFIPTFYSPDDVYVFSSYADRCLMSAQLVLAGLFPPVGEQIWNNELLWQPIPVHFLPRYLDNKLAIKKSCPSYEKVLKEAYNSDEIKQINEKNKDLYEFLTKSSGMEIKNIRAVEDLYNILEIEKINGLELPDWTKDVFPDKMKDLAGMSLGIFTKTEYMKKMHGGELIKEILTNIKNKIDGNLKPDRKLFLYSGHDLTVVSLMRILGYNAVLKPDFGASVYIEHHTIEKDETIKIYYRNNTNSNPEEMKFDYCKGICSFETFNSAMNKYVSDDWEEECKKG